MANRAADRLEESLQGKGDDQELAPLVHAAQMAALLGDAPPPPPHHLLPGRQRFLAEAARLREARASRQRAFGPLGQRARLAGALLSAILVLGLILGAGSAIASSLPGDPLYPVKLAIGEARLKWARDRQSQVDVALDVAGERLDEMARVMAAGQAMDEPTVSRLRNQLQWALQAVDDAQSRADQPALARHRANVHQWQQTMTRAVDEFPAPEQGLIQELARETRQLRQELRTGQSEPSRTQQGEPSHPTQSTATGQAGPQPTQAPGPQATATSAPPQPSASPPPAGQPGQGGPPPTTEQGPGEPSPAEPSPTQQPGPGGPSDGGSPGPGPGNPPPTRGQGEGQGRP